MCVYCTCPADDMGLGKTLSLISLVVQKKDKGVKEWMAKPPSKEGKTLIINNLSIIILLLYACFNFGLLFSRLGEIYGDSCRLPSIADDAVGR